MIVLVSSDINDSTDISDSTDSGDSTDSCDNSDTRNTIDTSDNTDTGFFIFYTMKLGQMEHWYGIRINVLHNRGCYQNFQCIIYERCHYVMYLSHSLEQLGHSHVLLTASDNFLCLNLE